MERLKKLARLRRILKALPEIEGQAILRRVKLRSVDGVEAISSKASQVPDLEEILCLPSKTGSVNSALTGKNLRHADCSPNPPVKLKRVTAPQNIQIPPISNFPPVQEYDGGIPDDPIALEVFALRRELEAKRQDLRAAQRKITRAMEALHSQRRFLRLGIYDNQWETYDELRRRLSNIEGVLQFLDDPVAGIESKPLEIPERWKKRIIAAVALLPEFAGLGY